MNVPDKAVEAAATKLYDCRPRCWHAAHRRDAKFVLEAALPELRRVIAAEALRDAAKHASDVADECEKTYGDSYRQYDQGVADAWFAAYEGLASRADRIERGES